MSEKIKFEIGGYYFSWDDQKARANVVKHGISFRLAAQVFFDDNAIVEPDRTTDEERYRIIGKTREPFFPVLFVVYIERDSRQIIRLISAREATRKEVKRYDQR